MNRKNLLGSIFTAALSFSAAHAATITINGGGSSLAYPTYKAEFQAFTASHSTVLFSFAAAGSGAGQKGFINNDITYFEPNPPNPNGYAAGTLTYGTIVGTAVDLGASDAFLTSSQLLNGGADGAYTGTNGSSAVDGPLIQIPTLGVPVTIAFVPPTGDKITTLDLTDAEVCGIFSGKVTNWDKIVSSFASAPINVVYRTDSSGTTFLLSQHLDKVCTTGTEGNSDFTGSLAAPTKTFATLFSGATVPTSGFTGASGSGGVQTALLATPGSIAYLSPDYTAIAPKSANTSATVQVASLKNAANSTYYSPSVANTETALENPGTGSSDGSPPSTLTTASNPLNWVPAIPQPSKGYPIVGYTTIDLSSCYANTAIGTAIIDLLGDAYTVSSYAKIINNNGFATLTNSGAAKFATAIDDDFLTNTSNYGLNIDNATTCSRYTGR